jgi:hypothetical protein
MNKLANNAGQVKNKNTFSLFLRFYCPKEGQQQ